MYLTRGSKWNSKVSLFTNKEVYRSSTLLRLNSVDTGLSMFLLTVCRSFTSHLRSSIVFVSQGFAVGAILQHSLRTNCTSFLDGLDWTAVFAFFVPWFCRQTLIAATHYLYAYYNASARKRVTVFYRVQQGSSGRSTNASPRWTLVIWCGSDVVSVLRNTRNS